MDDTTSRQRLGRLVADRIKKLQLTQEQISKSGGPSDATVRRIIAGHNARPSIYRTLESAIKWQPGSVAAVLAGGEPGIVTTWADLQHTADTEPAYLMRSASGRPGSPASLASTDELVGELIRRIADLERQVRELEGRHWTQVRADQERGEPSSDVEPTDEDLAEQYRDGEEGDGSWGVGTPSPEDGDPPPGSDGGEVVQADFESRGAHGQPAGIARKAARSRKRGRMRHEDRDDG